MSKPRTFQKLAMKAHDMEMMIVNHRSKLSSSYELKKDKGDSKKSFKPPKASMKETMTVSTEGLTRISGKSRPEGKKTSFSKETTKKCFTLKELQERKYHSLIQTCRECWMTSLKARSSNSLNLGDQKRLEGQTTRSTVIITGSLVTL